LVVASRQSPSYNARHGTTRALEAESVVLGSPVERGHGAD
jgi:hypothetical protein